MSSKSGKTTPKQQVRQAITLELVRAITPTETKAEQMSETFALEPVDVAGIREHLEEHVVAMSNELTDNLNEKAMQVFLQRIVGAYVGAAFSAANYYRTKQSEARAMFTSLHNDDRDEDREGVYGFEPRAERAAGFAAKLGLQAVALFAAAQGAAYAYAHVIGEEWKAYDPPAAATFEHRVTATMMAALEN
ncbi:MAG: hypothetical protein ABI369_10380 [Acetobacteraceae bacterium]